MPGKTESGRRLLCAGAAVLLGALLSAPAGGSGREPQGPPARRGEARADERRPAHFPHRIWAASDFETRLPDYAWFGEEEKENLPRYAGNGAALRSGPGPYRDVSAAMTGMNPVPGPRMGKVNQLYLRYFLRGGTEATFQHFSLSREDNQHLRVSGLTEGRWSELTLNFTRDAARNDGSPEPFAEGERMDDFKVFAGRPADAARWQLVIDDVIFFAEDPRLPPDPEPFPRRVIFLAAFDTGPKEKYWPGDFELVSAGAPPGSSWNVARAVPRRDGSGKWIRLGLEPPRAVGERTRLRFRYHLKGSSTLTVQLFDVTDGDNRHLRLQGLEQGAWASRALDFTRDSRRNDGSSTPFAAGHKVDDIFFLPEGGGEVELFVDEVVLYDGGAP